MAVSVILEALILIIVKMNKKNQIWVETVIYTLIGLSIIGVLLSIVKPAIEEKKDQIILDQSISILNTIDNNIEDIRYYGPGNSRPLELMIKKGEINIGDNQIKFSMLSSYKYSEVGQTITLGKINVTTIQKGKQYNVNFVLDYNNVLNITWNKEKQDKTLTQAPTSYKVTITNWGSDSNGLTNVDFS